MNVQLKTKRTATGRMAAPSILLAATLLFLFAGEADAQIGFAAEGRTAVTFPMGDLSDDGAETGIGVGAELHANFRQNLTAYIGFHRYAFGCDDDCTRGANPRSTGLGAGLKYIVHNPGDVLVWGRGGVVANTFDNDAGSGDREFGFEAGAGADMPIAERLYLVPNIGFVNHGGGNGSTIQFFTLGLGIHYHIR